MNCKIARQQIALWVGDDLNQKQTQSLIEHVDECQPCAEFREELLRSTDLLLSYNSQVLPKRDKQRDSVWGAIENKLADQVPERPHRSLLILKMTGTIVAAAMLMFLIIMPPLVDSSPQAIQVGEKPNLGQLPAELLPHYPDPTWRSLRLLEDDAPTTRADRMRNVGY